MPLHRIVEYAEHLNDIPDGEYAAIVGGYVSVVNHKMISYSFQFKNGVRGFNFPDLIYIFTKDNGDKVVKSNELGEIVFRKQG